MFAPNFAVIWASAMCYFFDSVDWSGGHGL
jgi:hypothetical protein